MAKLSPTDEGRQDFGPVVALEVSHDDITMGFTTFKEETDMAPILASLPAFIVRPTFSFIPVFRKHLALQPWNARRAGRR